MATHHARQGPNDDQLVARCLGGDRNAFRTIVERYQGLVCALTYAGCGDLHRSEDLAQETFLQAWKHLSELKEPARLRLWLCSIARNLIVNDHRRLGRAPAVGGLASDAVLRSPMPAPPEEAMRHEEQVLLWETLERLPVEYREPLVLYYRQEESLSAVAEALELSQAAARQRLSRGRAMLARRLERVIRHGLRTTGPTKAFTLAVISLLPGIAVSAAATATLSAVAATTKTTASTAVAGGLVGSILGPVTGLAGGYLGYRIGLDQAVTAQERRFIRRFFWSTLALTAGFTLLFGFSFFWTQWLGLTASVWAILLAGLSVGWVSLLLYLCFRYQRRLRHLRQTAIAENPKTLEQAQEMCTRWNREYKSRWTLLGLPLVHVNMGSTPQARAAVAKGWVAIGGKAYGVLFAAGGFAVGAISFGGFAVGLLTWGGFALGAFVFGGFAAGGWVLGGLGIGWQAIGGCVLAWSTAVGGVAIAHDYALGGIAIATHANDLAAESQWGKAWFSQLVYRGVSRYGKWLWLVTVPVLVPALVRWRAGRKQK